MTEETEKDERGAKERVYDAEIHPLLRQIIEISKRTGIPMHASFMLDGDLACTTHISPPFSEMPEPDREHAKDWLRRYDRAAGRALYEMCAFTIASAPTGKALN